MSNISLKMKVKLIALQQ